MKYLTILLVLSGCASVEDLSPPKFNPPINDYRYGDKAIVNTNGIKSEGFFDGKSIRIIGIKDSLVECEYVHGDHIDILRLDANDLIECSLP